MKFLKKILISSIGLAMAVGVGITAYSSDTLRVEAAEETQFLSSFNSTSGDLVQNIISYNTYKGGGTTDPGVYSNEIRLYQNSNGDVGGYLVLNAATGYNITSATIGSSTKTTLGYGYNQEDYASNNAYTKTSLEANDKYTLDNISASSVGFGCFGVDKNSRLNVNYLSVTYESATTAEITSVVLAGDMTNKSYGLGDPFDATGLTLTVNYDDNSNTQINDVSSYVTFNPATANSLDLTSVEVSATYNDVASNTLTINGITVSEKAEYEYDFVANFALWCVDWNSSYTNRNITISGEAGLLDAKIDFTSANIQSSNITDRPVSKRSVMTFTLNDANYLINGFTAEFYQWSSKTASISVNGGSASQLSFTNKVATVSSTLNNKNSFTLEQTEDNQVGWTSITISVVKVEQGELESISINSLPTKIVYEKGEELSLEGLQLTTIDTNGNPGVVDYDGSNIVATDTIDMNTSGKKTVTISYTSGEVTKTSTFDIYVSSYTYKFDESSLNEGTNNTSLNWNGLTWGTTSNITDASLDADSQNLKLGTSDKKMNELKLTSDWYSNADGSTINYIIVSAAGWDADEAYTLTVSTGDASNRTSSTVYDLVSKPSADVIVPVSSNAYGYIELDFQPKDNGGRLLLDSVHVISSVGDDEAVVNLANDISKIDVCDNSSENLTKINELLERYETLSEDEQSMLASMNVYDYQDGDTAHSELRNNLVSVEAKLAYMRTASAVASNMSGIKLITDNTMFIVMFIGIMSAAGIIIAIVIKKRKNLINR